MMAAVLQGTALRVGGAKLRSAPRATLRCVAARDDAFVMAPFSERRALKVSNDDEG